MALVFGVHILWSCSVILPSGSYLSMLSIRAEQVSYCHLIFSERASLI